MMIAIFKLRITIIWLLLVLMTCLSWEAVQSMGWIAEPGIGVSAVMIVAFMKVRLILLDFMELRHAPLPLRLFAEAWVTVVCLSILAMYWTHGGA